MVTSPVMVLHGVEPLVRVRVRVLLHVSLLQMVELIAPAAPIVRSALHLVVRMALERLVVRVVLQQVVLVGRGVPQACH